MRRDRITFNTSSLYIDMQLYWLYRKEHRHPAISCIEQKYWMQLAFKLPFQVIVVSSSFITFALSVGTHCHSGERGPSGTPFYQNLVNWSIDLFIQHLDRWLGAATDGVQLASACLTSIYHCFRIYIGSLRSIQTANIEGTFARDNEMWQWYFNTSAFPLDNDILPI